jgi:hypothetical protein
MVEGLGEIATVHGAAEEQGVAVGTFGAMARLFDGRVGVFRMVSKHYAVKVEGIIGALSGGAIFLFGALFIATTLYSFFY